MGKSLYITCIKRSGSKIPDERIETVGGFYEDGKYFRFTLDQAIELVEKNKYDLLVEYHGRELLLYVAYSLRGKKYLKTEVDWESPVTLLKLPECL